MIYLELGLKGRRALVTASSKGIGFAVAMMLAREGANVIISSRSSENLKVASKKIRDETGSKVEWIVADLTLREDVERLAAKVLEQGGVDILVFNTGGPKPGRFMELEDKDWDVAYELLLMSAVKLCRLLAPAMVRRRWGRIVILTSIAIKQPEPEIALSNILRLSLAGLVKQLSIELSRYNVTVNSVMPGYTLTDRLKQYAMHLSEAEGVAVEEIFGRMAGETAAGRIARPEEIASVVVFLASERASYITGALIPVDGGRIKCIF